MAQCPAQANAGFIRISDQGQDTAIVKATRRGKTIIGSRRDDTLVGSNGPDVIEGRAGNDTLIGKGGSDRLLGGLGDDTLIGGNGADILDGGNGDDRMIGGNGIDTYIGGPGADTIVLDLSTPKDPDERISDFNLPPDPLGKGDRLEVSAAEFGGGLIAGHPLDASQFAGNESGLAGTASVRFIYNTLTGQLYFDSDGNGEGAPVLIATFVGTLPVLTASDFSIVAP